MTQISLQNSEPNQDTQETEKKALEDTAKIEQSINMPEGQQDQDIHVEDNLVGALEEATLEDKAEQVHN